MAPQDTTLPAHSLIPALFRNLEILTSNLVSKWIEPVNIHGKNQVIAGLKEGSK
jgi:hypothetical protein